MKVRNIKISVKKLEEGLREFAETWEKIERGEKVEPREELSFASMDTLRKFLTKKRMELLHIIKNQAPESIYELAKLVKRDLKSVNTDIKVLVDLELVSLERLKERRKMKPTASFDKLNIEITI